MNKDFMDDLFKNDPGTLARCYPHEYQLRTNTEYREHMEGYEQRDAEAKQAAVSAAEKEKQRLLDEWQMQKEARGLTPEQHNQVREALENTAMALIKGMARATKEFIAARLAERDERIEALEKALETKSECLDSTREQVENLKSSRIDYCGLWDSGRSYQRNFIVTDHGSAWISLVDDNRSRPGTDSSKWMLMVKRGRDGGEAK